MTTIAERVAAGAAFLDEHDPGWWREDVDRAIDLDRFSIISGDRCILGQRCPLTLTSSPGFSPYAEFLSGASDFDQIWAWAVPLGFTWQNDLSEEAEGADMDGLAAEWKRVIGQRRAAA